MAEPLMLVIAPRLEGLLLRKRLESRGVGSPEVALFEALHEAGELPSSEGNAQAVAVPFFLSQRDLPANARQADDGVHESQDPLQVLDGHHLSVVHLLLPIRENPDQEATEKGRELVQLLELFQACPQMIGSGKELLHELPPPDIAQQVLGIVLGPEVPLLAFSVLVTELAHSCDPLSQLYVVAGQ